MSHDTRNQLLCQYALAFATLSECLSSRSDSGLSWRESFGEQRPTRPHFFGWDVKSVVTTIVLLAAGLGLYAAVRGATAAKSEIFDGLLLTATPTLFFFTALLLVNYIRAPYLMYLEEHKSAAALVSVAEAARTAAEADRNAAQGLADKEIERLRAALEAARKAPSSRSGKGTDLPGQSRAKVRERLAAFLLKAESLEVKCVQERGSGAIETELNDFYKEVEAFLETEIGIDAVSQFRTAMGSGVQVAYPLNKGGILGRIRGRKEFLDRLLTELRRKAQLDDSAETQLKASDLALRTAQNQVNTLSSELRSERGKLARAMLEKKGRKIKANVMVRFIDFSDGTQADYIKGLFLDTAGWTGKTVRDEGSTLRRSGSSRIEIASGNPENAHMVAGLLNHGLLVGEQVDALEIIESGSDDIIVTIFPRSSMPS